jgi:hypothetical protein
MDMMAPKISPEIQGVLYGEGGEVLVAEGDDLALCDEEGELVFAFIGQFRELHTGDFGARGRGELLDLGAGEEQVGEGRVCVEAVLGVCEGFEGWVFLAVVPDGEVVGELGSLSK